MKSVGWLRFERFSTLPVLLFVIVSGCGGGGMEEVTGVVAYPDGETLPQGGRVVFNSPTLSQSFDGYTDSEGKYVLRAPPGDYQVIYKPPGPQGEVDEHGELIPGTTPSKPLASSKYLSYETSGLSYSVEEGQENVYDIEVDHP